MVARSIDDFGEVYGGALSPAFCQQIIVACEQNPHRIQGKASAVVEPARRSGNIYCGMPIQKVHDYSSKSRLLLSNI